MNLEFTGTQMIGLCSKSYIAVNKKVNTRDLKYSLKGVNNYFLDSSDTFLQVLRTQSPINAVNRGIRMFENTL